MCGAAHVAKLRAVNHQDACATGKDVHGDEPPPLFPNIRRLTVTIPTAAVVASSPESSSEGPAYVIRARLRLQSLEMAHSFEPGKSLFVEALRCSGVRRVSEIAGDQVVRAPASANVEPGSGGTYQITVGVERVEKTRFVGLSIWLDALQCVFVYKKRRFHRAIMPPKPHSTPRSVI